jgi:hypothetical protein
VRIERTNGGHLKGIFSVGEHEVLCYRLVLTELLALRSVRVRADARRVLRSLTA